MYSQMSIGKCPECGDELYLFRTKSRKKVVKCVNDDFPKQFAYGVPKSGKIEVTGFKCPKNNLPVLAIIPNIRLAQGKYKKNTKGIYF
jgi:ssDNA-binding Zn-finger/Zn-ribbon topoisomerase 1